MQPSASADADLAHSPYQLRPATAADYDFLYQLKVAALKEYVAATWGWDEAYQRQHFAWDSSSSLRAKLTIRCG
jgi:hypothetical protein